MARALRFASCCLIELPYLKSTPYHPIRIVMDQTQVLEIGRQMRSGDNILEARLRETLAAFNTSRRSAIRNLLGLHGENPTAFALAAARVLADQQPANSVGSYYLAG